MLQQLVLLVVCQTVFAELDLVSKPYYDVNNYEVVGRHFEQFLKTYNRHYSQQEKHYRHRVFMENLMEINEKNLKSATATFDINQFTDMTKREQRSILGFEPVGDSDDGVCKTLGDPETKDAPAAYDWRDQKAVSPIKDQKSCGSCWAFSATALLESKALMMGNTVSLSEQQLVDCDKKSSGCLGGLMTLGLSDIIARGGQESESSYPYTAKAQQCAFDKSKVAIKVANCTDYKLSGEDALKELLYKEGPLSYAVDAMQWFAYKGGILDDCAFEALNHGVLLVGYGTENGVDYWVFKNSWGAAYGEQGFIRVKRGVGCSGVGNNQSMGTVTASIA